jgi:hypothetical protein
MAEIKDRGLTIRMDKTAFKKQSLFSAADHQSYYNNMSHSDQAKVFHVMMAAAYGFVGCSYPRMEKKLTGKKKISE